jgi:hypothetical protein
MKPIKILFFCVASFFLSCCNEAKIYMKYHFFTIGEVEDIYINTDSAINFQEKIANCITYEQFRTVQKEYTEVDTVLFLSDNKDTIKCRYYNTIYVKDKSDGLATSSDKESGVLTRLNPIDSCFISGVTFGFLKPKKYNDNTTAKSIGFAYRGYSDAVFSADLSENSVITSDNGYFILSTDTFTLNNIQIDNCMYVRFYNSLSIEQAVIIYSNKYGFLKLKDTKHEINRIL